MSASHSPMSSIPNDKQVFVIREFYKTEKTFIDNVKLLCEGMNRVRSWLNKEDKQLLAVYIQNYEELAKLEYEPFSDGEDAYDRILISQPNHEMFYKLKLAKIEAIVKQHKAFGEFLDRLAKSSNAAIKKIFQNGIKEGDQTTLPQTIAITPVQRTPRYVLLLNELKKQSTNDEASERLETVIKLTESKAKAINEAVRASENTVIVKALLAKRSVLEALAKDAPQLAALKRLFDQIERAVIDVTTIRGFLEVAAASPDYAFCKDKLIKYYRTIPAVYPAIIHSKNPNPLQHELAFARYVMYSQHYDHNARQQLNHELAEALDLNHNASLAPIVSRFKQQPTADYLKELRGQLEKVVARQVDVESILHEMELYVDKNNFIKNVEILKMIDQTEEQMSIGKQEFYRLQSAIKKIAGRYDLMPTEQQLQIYQSIAEFKFRMAVLHPQQVKPINTLFDQAKAFFDISKEASKSIVPAVMQALLTTYLHEGVGLDNVDVRKHTIRLVQAHHLEALWKQQIADVTSQGMKHPVIAAIEANLNNKASAAIVQQRLIGFVKWASERPVVKPVSSPIVVAEEKKREPIATATNRERLFSGATSSVAVAVNVESGILAHSLMDGLANQLQAYIVEYDIKNVPALQNKLANLIKFAKSHQQPELMSALNDALQDKQIQNAGAKDATVTSGLHNTLMRSYTALEEFVRKPRPSSPSSLSR